MAPEKIGGIMPSHHAMTIKTKKKQKKRPNEKAQPKVELTLADRCGG